MNLPLFETLRASKGQSLVEAALTLPLLLLLALGVFEFSRIIQAHFIISNMSREGANLASRTTQNPLNIMTALSLTADPLDMNNHGVMYVTQLQGVEGGGAVIIDQATWSGGDFTTPSRIGEASGSGTPIPANLEVLNNVDLQPGEVVQAVEVFYDYPVVFGGIVNVAPVLYSVTVF